MVNNSDRGEVQGSIKTLMNNTWVITLVPGRNKDTRIILSGQLTGSNRDADRATLKTYETQVRRFDDGIDNADYIIEPESLKFGDNDQDSSTRYFYTMVLLEWNQ